MQPVSPADLIERLSRIGVRLFLEGEGLRYQGPPGALTPELRRQLAERKRDIVPLLAATAAGQARSGPELGPVSRHGALPLSYGQQRLWYLCQLRPDDTSYNLWLAWRLRGPLDVGALEHGLGGLPRRHEALRTRFVSEGGVPRQDVLDGWASTLTAERVDGESEARAELSREAQRPFDVAERPPVRARLLRLADDDHVLMLTMHHLVSDGWSMRLLDTELWEAYDGRAEREAPAVQYADFAVWQRSRQEAGEGERQLAFCKRRLAGAPTRLDLAMDRARPAVKQAAAGLRPFRLDRELTERLKRLSRSQGVTLFVTLLAAFQVLLWRYSGQREMLIGTPVSGRSRGDLDGVVGFFVSTVVLRGDLRADPTFAELLSRVRDDVVEALSSSDFPFERLVDELDVERDPSRTPLFQVAFAMQDGAAPTRRAVAGLDIGWFTVGGEAEQFDLSLHIAETGDGLRGSLSYCDSLFEAATAKRMLRRYRRLLDEVASEPSRRLHGLGLPDGEERRRLVEEWNHTALDASWLDVEAEIAARSAERPDAVAVVAGGEVLTRGELEAGAARVAAALRAMGAGPEARVGLLSHRTVDLVAGLLGILRAGAAFVPLDPALPRARLDHMAADSGLRAVVEPKGLPPPVGGGSGWGPGPSPDNLAYVMYTSGSTGRPKGVAVTRRGLGNYVRWAAERYGLDVGGGSIVHTSIGFDLTLTSLLVPLVRGEPVVLVDAEGGVEGLAEALMTGDRCSLLKLTPAHLEALRRLVGLDELRGRVGALVVGGEQLRRTSLGGWTGDGPDVFNEYGPTEAVVGCVVHRLETGDRRPDEGAVPVGRPAPNTTAYVVGPDLELVAQGVTGELCVGGVQLARGYWGRPADTAERFVPDPWGEVGGRLYRTGDMVRWRGDGQLVFVGRRDGQVKVRGHRVETGEVEAVMREHPAVRQAAVSLGDRGLAGYVVWRTEERAEDLRAWLRDRLPPYMVPGVIVALDDLPLTSHGKVDRALLRELPSDPRAAAGRTRAPETELERALARIWAEVLEVDEVGVDDDFFDLGGHSLLAIEMLARVQAEVGVGLSPSALLEAPTIAGLASLVST